MQNKKQYNKKIKLINKENERNNKYHIKKKIKKLNFKYLIRKIVI